MREEKVEAVKARMFEAHHRMAAEVGATLDEVREAFRQFLDESLRFKAEAKGKLDGGKELTVPATPRSKP